MGRYVSQTSYAKIVETYNYTFGPGVANVGDDAAQGVVDWLNSFPTDEDPPVSWSFVAASTAYAGLEPRTIYKGAGVDGSSCDALNIPTTIPAADAVGSFTIYFCPETGQVSSRPL